MGGGQPLVELVSNIYSCATSMVAMTGLGNTRPLLVESGIKQGYPLSGLLFNFSIDHVIRAVQADVAQGAHIRGRPMPYCGQPGRIARTGQPGIESPGPDGTTPQPEQVRDGALLRSNNGGCTQFPVSDSRANRQSPLEREATIFLGAQVGLQIVPCMAPVAHSWN